jgi:hypothetical protein
MLLALFTDRKEAIPKLEDLGQADVYCVGLDVIG